MLRKFTVLFITVIALGIVLAQTPQAAEAQAPAGVTWQGQYYNNPYLEGTVTLTRQDSAVWFDWGNNAPAAGIGADGFSVRWTTDPYFAAGTYRFWALADDRIRVNVGYAFNAQIDTFNATTVGQLVSADVTLDAGVHHVQVDYQEATGSAYAFVTWANLATNPAGPGFPVPGQSFGNVNNGQWTAQYFNNPNLSGTPVSTQNDPSPTHNWGAFAPAPNLPVDNFSVRWTSTQYLNSGTYQLSVQADDGVRVFVDNTEVINEWHSASNLTYTAPLSLSAGGHTFVVEYYEGGGNAFINYTLAFSGGSATSQPSAPVNTGTTATVTAFRLNVRDTPSTSGNVVTKINQNEVYPVVGSNADKSWWQINVNGVVGWVFARFVTVSGAGSVPVSGSTPVVNQPSPTGIIVTTVATVNLRSQPNTSGAILDKIPFRGTAQVVGRNANNSWWEVNYNGLTGWVSSTWAHIPPGTATSQIPITG